MFSRSADDIKSKETAKSEMKTKKKKVHKIQELRKTKNRMHCEVSLVIDGLENSMR